MSDNKKKDLTPEQVQKLQQLQMLMQQQMQNGGKAPKGNMLPTGPKPPLAQRIFFGILQKMSGWVKFIDQFVDLVVKKDGGNANDVVKSARSPILFGVAVTIFFGVFGVLWAATAPLNSAAYAVGLVVSETKRQNVNHAEQGIIKEIYIKPGDRVEKGDKLIVLDDVRIRSSYQSVLSQYRTSLASETRLLAHINHQELKFPEELLSKADEPEVARIIETQTNFYNSRRDAIQAERDSRQNKVEQLIKQIEGLKSKGVALKKNLDVIQERLEATKKLNQQGYAQKAVLLELEAKEASMESDIAVNEISIISAQQDVAKANLDLYNLDNQMNTELSNELTRTQLELSSSKEKLAELEDYLAKTVIRAPISGIVNNLNYYTIGSVIPASYNILEIIPQEDKLVIEAKIPPRHISSVQPGLKCKIKFSAFKSRTSPMFFGELVSVSPDLVIDVPQAGQPSMQPGSQETAGGYYAAKIEIDMDHFNKLAKSRNLVLLPGMQAEIQIITGERTLLQYLLDPLYDAMFKGFKEK